MRARGSENGNKDQGEGIAKLSGYRGFGIVNFLEAYEHRIDSVNMRRGNRDWERGEVKK